MVNLRKLEMTCLGDHSDTMLYQINKESLENCNFHVFSIFSLPVRKYRAIVVTLTSAWLWASLQNRRRDISFPIFIRKEIETRKLERKSKQKISRLIDLLYCLNDK